MENKKPAVIIITITFLLAFSIIEGKPFQHETKNAATIVPTSFKIAIIDGKITRYHIILTVNGPRITTNGEIILATAKGKTATYTIIKCSNNSFTTTTLTVNMDPVPDDFIMTYSNRYLTYNGLTYYTGLGPPITFLSSRTNYYSDTIIVEISKGILSWASTTKY